MVGLVGHCGVRYYMMGERAVDQPASFVYAALE
jgi:hypothetical protein